METNEDKVKATMVIIIVLATVGITAFKRLKEKKNQVQQLETPIGVGDSNVNDSAAIEPALADDNVKNMIKEYYEPDEGGDEEDIYEDENEVNEMQMTSINGITVFVAPEGELKDIARELEMDLVTLWYDGEQLLRKMQRQDVAVPTTAYDYALDILLDPEATSMHDVAENNKWPIGICYDAPDEGVSQFFIIRLHDG